MQLACSLQEDEIIFETPFRCYGHIAPKTQTGKVVTILYAILGIPLMLLCLSNIGDVMASSFRFLYWRVCCYVCTRPPKRRRRRHASVRSVRGRPGSTRRRRAPPGLAPPAMERAHSDTDFRYRDSGYSSGRARRPRAPRTPRTRSQPPAHAYRHHGPDYEPADRSPARFVKPEYDEENEEFPKISLPLQDLAAALKDLDDHREKYNKMESRSKSLPRPAKRQPDYGPRRDFDSFRYEPDDRNKEVYQMHDLHDVDYENFKERKALEEREKRIVDDDYDTYRDRGYDPEDEDFEFDDPRHRRTWDDRRRGRGRSEFYDREEYSRPRGRRAKSAVYDYEHHYDHYERERDGRWADAEGGKGRRLRRLHTVDDSRYPSRYTPSPDREEWSDEELPPRRSRPPAFHSRQIDVYATPLDQPPKEEIKPVPIWLCVLLVASYIVAGTFLFKRWEGWPYLDAAYFCFITLTTIGFGDFVPAQYVFHGSGGAADAAAAVHSIALCSLYLLFGIALLAMSFNLVQEEVRANVAALATRLGIIKPEHGDSDDDSDY
ncbi:hypothetical protein JYU34_017769 [Plutella xylostella]|uniref:Potassium channel domain-containing protein n=1 Tax=Plutella xylostella TaxID=51655 RepID=A0ABQ7Q1X0_PLUXY|nr:hypothetical protein JYU34_017769 [Plutella xylostella]